MKEKRLPKHFLRRLGQIFYQMILLAMSVGIVLFLPYLLISFGRVVRAYWSLAETKDIYLLPIDIGMVLLLVLLFNYLGKLWRDRRFAKMARRSGIMQCFDRNTLLAKRKIRRLKRKQSCAENVLIIASTGFHSFVDPRGDLQAVLKNCRQAKIMLINPYGEGAMTRTRSILEPSVTPQYFKDEIKKSIDFLKELKDFQNNIRLKLYEDPPFLKLAILGDDVWMKHYHPGFDVDSMPEYLFERDQNPGGLYTPFLHYFMTRWENADIPEYDFDSDELVYRDVAGKEINRKKFHVRDQSHSREEFAEDPYPGILSAH